MPTLSAKSPCLLQVAWAHDAPGPAAHVALFSLYAAAALLTLGLGLGRPDGWSVWPAASLGAGIGLGAVCRCGTGMLPAVFVAAAGANLMSGIPVVEAIGVAGAQAAMILAAVLLMRRLRFGADLSRFRDFLILVVSGPGLLALVSGLVAVLLHLGVAGCTAGVVARAWLAMATGCMLMAPLLLMVLPKLREQHAELGLDGYLLVLALALLVIASQMRALDPELTTALSYAVLVAAAIIAMFQTARTVAIAVAVAGICGAVAASLSIGPFDHPASADERLLVLIKLCLMAFVALSVSAVRSEHQRLSMQGSERLQRIARSGEARAREDVETQIAGELNQPLTAIRTYAQSAARQLARELPEGDQKALRRALEGIVSGTERAARGVRARRGGEGLPRTEVGDFVHHCLSEASWELGRRRIRLRENIESDLPMALVCQAELERVVLLALHISIELAGEKGSDLQLDCRLDTDNGVVLIEFRVRAGGYKSGHPVQSPHQEWTGWLERLDRFEAEGGYFLLREEGNRHVIRIGLPAALDEK